VRRLRKIAVAKQCADLLSLADLPITGPSQGYFPPHYQPSPSHVTAASPRTSISHLVTPSADVPPTPIRPSPFPPPFAFTPGGTALQTGGYERESSTTSSRPSSSHQYFPPIPRIQSQSPHASTVRGSLQGWTNGEDRGEFEPQMRKITPTGGSLAAVMNPSPEAHTGTFVGCLDSPRANAADRLP
jgi:hypothetical protein